MNFYLVFNNLFSQPYSDKSTFHTFIGLSLVWVRSWISVISGSKIMITKNFNFIKQLVQQALSYDISPIQKM